MEKNYKIILSIIWGLCLASLFRKICDKNSCVVIKIDIKLHTFINILSCKILIYAKNNDLSSL